MKKFMAIVFAAAAMLVVGCASVKGSAGEANPALSKYVGEWDIDNIQTGGKASKFSLFIIKENGEISGAVDNTGYTAFVGQVNEDGTFTADMFQLGGTIQGSIDENGVMTGFADCRGAHSTLSGVKK